MLKPLIFTLLCLIHIQVFAQVRVISGKVTAMEDKQALPGVNIIIPGTTKGSTTDFDGNYKVEVSENDKFLAFSFIGYKTQTIDISGKTLLDIVLETDAEVLEEVVVVGYGIQKKTDITGA